ncbi:MAG: flagellar basal body-associated FliL family protein [Ferrovibrio sp.]|jgi:flagellar FliL protein|uniref:flagellar basal body-associated FliL family protein n=1 Tax=Ferrovibrio sp. TaxID=1917215 RepID=UPI00391B9CC7
MSDETEGQEGGEELEGKKKKGKRAIVIIAAAVLLLLVLGGGGAAYFFLFAGSSEEAEVKPEPPKVTVFYDLPDILVNLNSTGRQASYLKLKVALEHNDPLATPKLNELLPRVTDNFQIYLRELRPDDLVGSAGLYRLKEELLIRVNQAVAPIKINDVLFKEMLIQ